MTSVLRHSIALLAIALHLFAAVAVEYVHHDGHETGSSRVPAFISHDCGPNERHLPIDGDRVCAFCVYAFSLVAAGIVSPAVPDVPAAHAPLAERSGQRADSSDLYHSGKRGPPAA
jgi:hypothetical protein